MPDDKTFAPPRPTEGSREGDLSMGKGPQTAKRRGRPPGSRNKPKSLIPADIANQLLDVMKDRLPGEHYQYMRGVIVKGDAISTEREVDMLITLVRGSLMPYLAMEALPGSVKDSNGEEILDEDGNPKHFFPGLNRDVTDRLKLLNSLLGLKENIEKRKANGDDQDKEHVILKVVADRGLDPQRLAFLAGYKPGDVAGDADGTGRPALPSGAISSSVVERQESKPDRQ